MKSFLLKHSGLQFLALILLVCLTYAITTADITAEPATEPSAETADITAEPATESPAELETEPLAEPPMEAEEETESPLKERMQKRISIEFRSTPIEDALMLMADQANVDIVKSPSVTGTVTVKLTDVPLGEALDNILAAHGYGYAADKNMIRVAPADEITQVSERIINRIYRITYADVREVEISLKRFISQQGTLSSNPGTSHIIVTDTESQIKAIDKFIEEIDRMTPQVLVEARIYDITSKDRLDLGVEWNAGRNTQYYSDAAGETEAIAPGAMGVPKTGQTTPFITSVFSAATSETSSTIGLLKFGWLREGLDLDAVIKAQKENIDAKLLANPRVLVLDNETALFKIIEEIPYQQLTQTTGAAQIGTTSFKEVGVTLEVKPHIITEDNMIRLQLKPEFSVDTGNVLIGGLGYPQPIVAKREADTTLLVKNGQTIVLGGLRKKDVSHQINKIPLLGDLPLIGLLFKFEGEETINSEIIVFVTPWIIEPEKMAEKPDLENLSETEKTRFEVTEFSGPTPLDTRAEKKAGK